MQASGYVSFPVAAQRASPTNRVLMNLRAAYRLLRVSLHLINGLLIVALVYPGCGAVKKLTLKQQWSARLVRLLGISLNWSGNIPAGGLLVSNHISFVDVYAINAIVPCSFVAKDEVRRWPLLGWLAMHSENLFLERGNRRAAHHAREHIVTRLRAGKHVALFPEGTTSSGDGVLPFHSALFQAAIDAATDVTPIVITYSGKDGARNHAADYVGETSLVECLWSIACARDINVTLALLPSLSAKSGDRRHLSAHAHHAISHALSRQLSCPL